MKQEYHSNAVTNYINSWLLYKSMYSAEWNNQLEKSNQQPIAAAKNKTFGNKMDLLFCSIKNPVFLAH